jgi:hypothetical protein
MLILLVVYLGCVWLLFLLLLILSIYHVFAGVGFLSFFPLSFNYFDLFYFRGNGFQFSNFHAIFAATFPQKKITDRV